MKNKNQYSIEDLLDVMSELRKLAKETEKTPVVEIGESTDIPAIDQVSKILSEKGGMA